MPRLSDIQIRDPFVLVLPEDRRYWLFGTTDPNAWSGPGIGFDCWSSSDLATWDGPFSAFRPAPGFAGMTNFWAPGVHRWHGRFWMFASFKNPDRERWTQALVADRPQGPYTPVGDGLTPRGWSCLDGTLHVDSDDVPWLVFCHEWTQVTDGRMMAARLAPGFDRLLDDPVELFRASAAPWVKPLTACGVTDGRITDGPFLRRSRDALLMLWSSLGEHGYAMGLAISDGGAINGPWRQADAPLWGKDGGHGMFFDDLSGRTFMTLHRPNNSPMERAHFAQVRINGTAIEVA
jgi:arabinan endo-1,5-alpha-L-arabinosidase